MFIDLPLIYLFSIIMEYCDDGDVYEKIKKHKKDRTYIKERQIWKILI